MIYFTDAKVFWQNAIRKKTAASKLVGLDLSPRRIGISVSDASQEYALPRGVLHVRTIGRTGALETCVKGKSLIAELQKEFKQVLGWIIGWPLELSGKEGYRTRETIAMVKLLQPLIGVELNPVLLHDERYSTALAYFDRLATSPYDRHNIDALAASRILQEFLDLKERFKQDSSRPS